MFCRHYILHVLRRSLCSCCGSLPLHLSRSSGVRPALLSCPSVAATAALFRRSNAKHHHVLLLRSSSRQHFRRERPISRHVATGCHSHPSCRCWLWSQTMTTPPLHHFGCGCCCYASRGCFRRWSIDPASASLSFASGGLSARQSRRRRSA